MSEWRFKRDTAFRKQFFVPDSFAHPAKMDAQLLIRIVEEYTKPGEVILDPMAGSGTMMLACTMGRDVVLVELEEKFCKMCRDNWKVVRMRPQLGYSMGSCQVIQGDARNLEGLMADAIVSSPPHGDAYSIREGGQVNKGYVEKRRGALRKQGRNKLADSLRVEEYGSRNPDNIGNLHYGDIDKIITSPPYSERMDGGKQLQKGFAPYSGEPNGWFTTRPQENIGNLRYGNIDSIITSPPYEVAVSASTGGERDLSSARQREKRLKDKGYDPAKYQGGVGRNLEVDFQYSKTPENIGNLKGGTYLEAMYQVYSQCWKVLKAGGLMILVTKNFIRNQKEVRLDEDTIKLCEKVGFRFIERHYRKLSAQSFWRTIYQQKYPDAPVLDKEDVLVLRK